MRQFPVVIAKTSIIVQPPIKLEEFFTAHDALLYVNCLAAELAKRNGQVNDNLPAEPAIEQSVWSLFQTEGLDAKVESIVFDEEDKIAGGRDHSGAIWANPIPTELALGFFINGKISRETYLAILRENVLADTSDAAKQEARESQIDALNKLITLCEEHKHKDDKAPVHE
jgi:hypothetical protein